MNIQSIALVVFGLFSLQVSAATVTFSYDQSFGAVPPDGPAPYATATFIDTAVDTVTLEMQVAGTVGAANVTEMYFNLDSALDPTLLSFTRIGGTGPTASQTDILTGIDAFRAGGDGFYDILFDLPPPPGNIDSRFEAGENLVYELSMPGLSADAFNVFSTQGPSAGNPGPFLSVAKFQSTGVDQNGSDWVGAVPIPGAVWLFSSGLIGLIGIARRKQSV